MPDYSKLRSKLETLMSHRVRVELDTGGSIVGMLGPETTLPEGPILLVQLNNVLFYDQNDKEIGRRDDLVFCANMMRGISLDEGPRGRTVDKAS